jgi:anti-sigma B factor antagonist
VPKSRNPGQATVALLDEGAARLEDSNQEYVTSDAAGGRPRLRLRLINGFAVVEIVGAQALFDWGVIRHLSDQLHHLVEQGHIQLLLNLTGIRFISSDFLATLVALQRRIAAARGRLGLFGLDPVIWEMVQICRLELVFDIFDDERNALAARHAAGDLARLE